MMCRTLIGIIDELNEGSAASIELFKPERVVFIVWDRERHHETFDEIQSFLKNKMKDLKVTKVVIKEMSMSSIAEKISPYMDKDTIIDLSEGSNILCGILLTIGNKQGLTSVILDQETEKVYEVKKETVREMDLQFPRLRVRDLIDSAGADILGDKSLVYQDEDVSNILDTITANYPLWLKLRRYLKNMTLLKISSIFPNRLQIRLSTVPREDREALKTFFMRLKVVNVVEIVKVSDDALHFDFKDKKIRNLFMVSGAWLEAITMRTVSEIQGINDVKGGVRFLWNETIVAIKNEVDVIASFNASLICISCKDTNKYDDYTLDELYIHSEIIGGNKVKRILVATEMPYKKTVIKRAKEMKIPIIIFKGDLRLFRMQLKAAIYG